MDVPKVGVMLVGWGGNNGSTVTGAILANKLGLEWQDREGVKTPNYWGSVTQASTVKLGTDEEHNDVFVPMKSMLPMVEPNELVIGGWDINSANLDEAMTRAQVRVATLLAQPFPSSCLVLDTFYFLFKKQNYSLLLFVLLFSSLALQLDS